MVINEDKTKLVIFKSKRKKISENIEIIVNKKAIEPINTFSYLGVKLDSNLNWDDQYTSVSNKLTQRIHMINRNKHSISYKWMTVFSCALL